MCVWKLYFWCLKSRELTKRRRSWQCERVLVADGDSRKTHLRHVFNTYIDVRRIRKVVHGSIYDLICGDSCSKKQQHQPDGPSEYGRWLTGDIAKSDDRHLRTERIEFKQPWDLIGCPCCRFSHLPLLFLADHKSHWLTDRVVQSSDTDINSAVSYSHICMLRLECESKKIPSVFWHFSQNGWEFLIQSIRAYYMFPSTLD